MRAVIVSIVVSTLVLSIITPVFALKENGVIEMPYSDNIPTIDGKWTTTEEWSDAAVTDMKKDSHEVFLLVKHDRDYIYIMFDAITDQTPTESGKARFHVAFLMFDTNNDGGIVRQADDIRMVYGLIYNENGMPLDYSDQTLNKITVGDISAYGGINIMTPQGFMHSVAVSSKNSPYESGRDHYIHEFRIPISFLHKSDAYGFAAYYETGTSYGQPLVDNRIRIDWPSFTTSEVPNQWGNLISPDNTITAPPIPIISVSEKSLSFGNEEISEKSTPKTVTISNLGTSLLKINSIRTSGEFSISGISTPIEIPSNQKAVFEVSFVPITIGKKTGMITISSNDLSHPTMTLDVSGIGVEKGTNPLSGGGGCLIATAAFGSELTPQVQFLRDFRDNHILSTVAGSSFMNVFNTWYYSFSPYVADYERQQPWLQQTVKTAIYPLLGILQISEKGYYSINGEYGALVSGALASSMIGALYFWPFALSVKQVRTGRFNYKIAISAIAIVSVAVVGSIIAENEYALMTATSLFVLTLLSVSAILAAKIITTIKNRILCKLNMRT